ncbi:MAG: hypothetical protein AABX98_00750 [Nanoarchaeota archaeon]
MMTKTMKGVEDETWAEFKSLAARNNLKTGQFFEKLLAFYKENRSAFWTDILKGEKIISDNEAADMQKIVRKLRLEKGFRT